MTSEIVDVADCVGSVLVVDDDFQVRKVFTAMLATAGYSVRDAANGIEAKAAVQTVRFDVMILDLRMPEMDGFDVLKFVRSKLPSLKIIVVSGFMQGGLLQMAKYFGAAATLEKPVQLEVLLATVRTVLRAATAQG